MLQSTQMGSGSCQEAEDTNIILLMQEAITKLRMSHNILLMSSSLTKHNMLQVVEILNENTTNWVNNEEISFFMSFNGNFLAYGPMFDRLIVPPLMKFWLQNLYVTCLGHIDYADNNFRGLLGGSLKIYRRLFHNFTFLR